MPHAAGAVPSMSGTTGHLSERFLRITPDRLLYVGLLGAPSTRTMGSFSVYVAYEGAIRVRMAGGDWQVTELAVVPRPQSPGSATVANDRPAE